MPAIWRMRTTLVTFAAWALLLLLTAATVVHLNSQLTPAANVGDAVANVRMALAVERTGVFAGSPGGGAVMYREPLPIYALAAQMAVDPRFADVEDTTAFDQEGPINIALKQHNLIWAAVLMIGLIVMVRAFTSSIVVWFIASAAAIVLTQAFFLENPAVLNLNYTEMQAGALLVWTGAVAGSAVRSPAIWRFVVLGLLLGGLSLVKGAFFYVVWPYLALMLLLLIVGTSKLGKPNLGAARSAGCIAAAALGAMVLVGPWMVRNQVHFGTLNIAERGGIVLWLRALKDEMNDQELRGAYFVWSPGVVRAWLGPKLGFTVDDLEAGGPLQRLNRSGGASFVQSDLEAARAGRPQDAISFYTQAVAERTRLRLERREQGLGSTEASTIADRDMQDNALKKILSNPVGHLRTTPAFLWRSMWAARSVQFNSLTDARMSVLGMAALWIVGLGSLIARRPALFGAVAMAVGMVAFYALATHALPRYTQPAVPVMMACIALLGAWTLQAAVRGGVWAWKLASARLAARTQAG